MTTDVKNGILAGKGVGLQPSPLIARIKKDRDGVLTDINASEGILAIPCRGHRNLQYTRIFDS